MVSALAKVDVVAQSSDVFVNGLSVRNLVMNISSQTMRDLSTLPYAEQLEAIAIIGGLFLSSFQQISMSAAERNTQIAP